MSTPLAGKFQDHYEVLGISPKADSETIQEAYAELARKYHPNNPATGDEDAFEAVNAAYEVLCDPAQRAAFDNLKGTGEDLNCPKFSGRDFFGSLGREAGLRAALLCILYDRRRNKPLKPGLPMRYVEAMLAAEIDELFFVLWYAKQKGWVSSDDKSNLLITMPGMDYLENNPPTPALVMPFIKASALVEAEATGEAEASAEPGVYAEPSVYTEREASENVLIAALNAALGNPTRARESDADGSVYNRTPPMAPN